VAYRPLFKHLLLT